jgi:ATP-dependent DNA ligase
MPRRSNDFQKLIRMLTQLLGEGVRASFTQVASEAVERVRDRHLNRIREAMKIAEPSEVVDIARQALHDAPGDDMEALVADELPSMLKAKGIKDTSWVEPELERVVSRLVQAAAEKRKALQARTILRYDAQAVRRGVTTG